jgi:hypothetical protein
MKCRELLKQAGAQAQMTDDERPRPCPYCLQWLTKRFKRHMRKCPRYDAAATLVECEHCHFPIAKSSITYHTRLCRLKHYAQLGDKARKQIRKQHEQLEQRIARRKLRSMQSKRFVRSGTRSGTECRHEQPVLAIVPLTRYSDEKGRRKKGAR